MKHTFGGIWTRKKLAVLESYLRFYVNALKNQPFTLHYADAFAGTGSHDPIRSENEDLFIPEEDFKGSVLTALDVEPGFDQYHFNDLNPTHVSELEKIKAEHSGKQVKIYQMDANQFVPQFCASLGQGDRAVLLLDPYSTQLDWATLGYVASSQKVDLWLLFPISVILRMTPTDEARVRPEWKATLGRLLGGVEWEAALYKPIERSLTGNLFEDQEVAQGALRVNTAEVEAWVTNRLKEIFPYVARPVMLTNNGKPLFLFYFAISNPSRKAWGLADRVASHIISKNIGAGRS